jgi:hypothetical protein
MSRSASSVTMVLRAFQGLQFALVDLAEPVVSECANEGELLQTIVERERLEAPDAPA